MKLLVFNLAVDDEHVTLAFSLRWIEALAARCEHIDVVTMTAAHHNLPLNVKVWSVGRERGYPKWFRAARFYFLVWRILRQRRIDVVFTHMVPIFAILFWPLAVLFGLKNVLWYAHGASPITLRLAHRLVDRVVSSTPEGFRLITQKAVFIGQGIDMDRYRVLTRTTYEKLRIVTIGRLAPSKGLDLLVSALAGWESDVEWHLTVIGGGTSESENEYAKDLRQQAFDVLEPCRVTFTGRLDPDGIVASLAQSDVFINLSSTGSLDKAIIEAMATGCTVVSSNEAFREIAIREGFPQCVFERSEDGVRAALDRLVAMGKVRCQALGLYQAEIARRDHTLSGLIERLHGVLAATAQDSC